MPVITAITAQKRDKTRCNIEVDGRFFCGMKLETVVKNRLKAGDSVTAEELFRIQFEGEKAEALDRALSHISASMKTEREIRDFLKKRGYLEEIADYVVGRMKEYSYLDDGAYAASYAASAGKRKGARRIALELRAKGLDDEDIAAAVAQLSDQTETAKAVLQKYLRGKEADAAVLRRAYAYLLGKGFDGDTARSALSAWGQDED